MADRLRAVIYARVSTEGQAEEEASITAQVKECEDYAIAQGWEFVEVIQDGGMSGRTDERPGFQRMIAMPKKNPGHLTSSLLGRLIALPVSWSTG